MQMPDNESHGEYEVVFSYRFQHIQAKAENGVSYLDRAKDLARFGLAEARRTALSLHPAQGVVSIADSEPDSGSTETEF